MVIIQIKIKTPTPLWIPNRLTKRKEKKRMDLNKYLNTNGTSNKDGRHKNSQNPPLTWDYGLVIQYTIQ